MYVSLVLIRKIIEAPVLAHRSSYIEYYTGVKPDTIPRKDIVPHFLSICIGVIFILFVSIISYVKHVFIHIFIDARVNTCYNIVMIRKGDTKDAINTKRDD